MGKRIKRKIQILLRFVRQVVRGVACHAMFTTYNHPIGLKAIYLTFLNEFIWNQIKIFMSPLPISSMHGFWGGGVDCGFKGLEALECEL